MCDVILKDIEVVVVECENVFARLRRKGVKAVGIWEMMVSLARILVGLARKEMVARCVCELVTRSKLVLQMRKGVILVLGMLW